MTWHSGVNLYCVLLSYLNPTSFLIKELNIGGPTTCLYIREGFIKLAQTNDNDYIIPCPEIAPCLEQCAVQYSTVQYSTVYSGSGNLWSPTLDKPHLRLRQSVFFYWHGYMGSPQLLNFQVIFQNTSRILFSKGILEISLEQRGILSYPKTFMCDWELVTVWLKY